MTGWMLALIFFSLVPDSLALTSPTSGLSSALPTPSSADVRFDQWCDQNGIFRIGVQTITTPKSLGGRGLFASKAMACGTVVASIPAKLAIVAEDGVEWQVSLTNQVMGLRDDRENEWIQSWEGSGSLPIGNLLGQGKDPEAANQFVDDIAGQGSITREGAMAKVEERLTNYNKRLEHLHFIEEDTPKWYTLVMSRAAYLGKDWDYRTGAVPFFDMLNHIHSCRKSNADLMTFGDCLDRSARDSETASAGLDRKDFLLVLTQDVEQGEELLTQYDRDAESEETQLQLLLQYGIPPPS